MALKLNSIKADLKKEDEGDWVAVAEWPGVRFLVRSINSKDYQNAREASMRKLARTLGRPAFSSESEPHINKLIATHLLRGWEGIVGEDDVTPLAYSKEEALRLCTDPEMRELVEQVTLCAMRVGASEADFTKDAAKN